MMHRFASLSRVRWRGCFLFLLVAAPRVAAADPIPLEAGYRQLYNLDFTQAHRTFEAWKQQHPDDPMGPVSNAAAYLFSEFDRLHILEVELFTDNTKFLEREQPKPDPNVKDAFQGELNQAGQLADRILTGAPQDKNAQFARILADGLRSDYLALIEKRNLASLSYTKSARGLAEKLIAQDSSYYDAYLAVGVENYLLGVNAAPIRWLLRLGGAETNKDAGLNNLRITADKGHYLAPFARLLLAVAALPGKDRQTAKRLLADLSAEFPQNDLYRRELARIP